MKNDIAKKLRQLELGRKRADQVAQGMYDGRFKNKVVPDKKKQSSKNYCRKFKHQ
jgi:hypothetical protein